MENDIGDRMGSEDRNDVMFIIFMAIVFISIFAFALVYNIDWDYYDDKTLEIGDNYTFRYKYDYYTITLMSISDTINNSAVFMINKFDINHHIQHTNETVCMKLGDEYTFDDVVKFKLGNYTPYNATIVVYNHHNLYMDEVDGG